MKLSSYTLAVVLIALRSVAADDSPKPPIVDLGYELHQAAILQVCVVGRVHLARNTDSPTEGSIDLPFFKYQICRAAGG